MVTKKKKKPAHKTRLFQLLVKLAVLGVLLVAAFVGSIYLGVWGALPTRQALQDISNSQSTIVYDTNQRVVGKYYLFDRTSIQYDDLPQHLVDALVATEDYRFYEHGGIDYMSLMRVLIKTLILGDRSAGGGSTISQQLIKNLYPREDPSKLGLAIAKIKEGFTARRIEKVYSKEEIITLYFNTVSFPDNVYGIESASQKFYNKPVSALTLGEAATLVGSLKANSTYNPRLNPEKSHHRRNVVLSQMVKYDYLSAQDYDALKEKITPLDYDKRYTAEAPAPYFIEQVRLRAKALLSKYKKKDGTPYNLYTDGLKIHTTLDLPMQRMAEKAVQKHMPSIQKSFENNWGKQAPWIQDQAFVRELIVQSSAYQALTAQRLTHEQAMDSLTAKKNMTWFDWGDPEHLVKASTRDSLLHYIQLLNTGFLSLDPHTGAIKTWIGGINYDYFKYDHVNLSKRQVGSTFKPFVYAAALESGVEPCDYISGKRITYTNFDNWTPSNGESEYEDKYLSMQAALTKSINTVAVKVMEKAGVNRVVDLAQRAGIQSKLEKLPSLALGTAELSLIELAEAYTIFLNDGYPSEPYMIESIVDADGEEIYVHEASARRERVISDYTYEVMQQLLRAVTLPGGTGSRLRWKYGLTNDLAGKTGTTQSNRDGWFVGMAPDLLTVTWVGADNHSIHFKDTRYGQGANSALPIFALFYQQLNGNANYRGLTQARFDSASIEVQSDLDCPGIKEENFFQGLFRSDEKPKEKSFEESEASESEESESEESEEEKGVFKKIKKLFKRGK
ncbi:hypothetical protein BFP72_07510 [Reichenbachiella sp. 5M10]|uniref:penicillin-binding protein 1A n=1 Tax=Reichenbachiella sp. 5M10 TaxID=1889772 RepID=UPI000C146798|nr:transglycosylase domain-containing protein [Reichenbachiella sp. 5M10]PIB35253.1 hypothetical protein BFP72_07510 [Reichenbachiella sp. 5M10]